MEIEIILVKNEIQKLIWKIQFAYQQPDGSYDIPKKYLETLETLKNTLELINKLWDEVEVFQSQLSTERINYLKSQRKISRLNNTILNLNKTIAEMTKKVKL